MIILNEAIQHMDKRFHAFNGTPHLVTAFNAGRNVLFTGPGGYGKSEAAIHFFNFLKEKEVVKEKTPFILSFGQGMTEEKLFAGLDIKQFNETGEIKYNLEKSFLNHEYVIFEELFDAPASVLLSLKQVLQAKKFQLGTEEFSMKTKIIIACTNRSYDEVVSDNSVEALLQRFLFEETIVWHSHRSEDYFKALKKSFPLGNDELMEVVANAAEASNVKLDTLLSPRTVAQAYQACVDNDNPSSMQYIRGFHVDAVAKAIRNLGKPSIIKQIREIQTRYDLWKTENERIMTELIIQGAEMKNLTKMQRLKELNNIRLDGALILSQKSMITDNELQIHSSLMRQITANGLSMYTQIKSSVGSSGGNQAWISELRCVRDFQSYNWDLIQ